MKLPKKKRKSGLSIVPGPCNEGPGQTRRNATTRSTSISKVLRTHATRHSSINKDGTITHHRSQMVVPSAGFQVGSGNVLGYDWYSSLFHWPTFVGKERDLTVNDIDGPSQYDPVVDEQVATPVKRLRVSSHS